MSLRNKLLTYFFGISILIIIVGMVFYLQLKNLIEPLAPESIPQSVAHLTKVIDRNEMMHALRYQALRVEYNLENYLFTHQTRSLQKYYKNDALLRQKLDSAKRFNPAQFPSLMNAYDAVSQAQLQFIHTAEKKALLTPNYATNNFSYQNAIHVFNRTLKHYFGQPSRQSNESAVVTVRLAAKNSHNILQKSLNTTLIIFVDAIIASLLLVFLSTRAIVRPINLLRNNIEQMNVEKMKTRLNPHLLQLSGEVGDLARSFADMFHRLRVSTVLRDELLAEIKKNKETEARLQATALRLHESNLDLDQFAYAASHDLRAPLKAIDNLTKWIEEDCYYLLPEKSRRNFDLIKRRIRRLDALISGMLEYSRAGRTIEAQETIDLNHLVQEIIDTLAPAHHIDIHIKTTLPIVITEKTKITQVFLNLISNAIKYNDKKEGHIIIGYQISANYYQFYVEDNGCGIDAKFFEKIFEIFQSLHPRDMIESSGIGLAIVKKIIDKKGGTIWLTSKLHHGTTFYFTWPI